VRLRPVLLVLAIAVVVGVGQSQATVSNEDLSLSESSPYAVVAASGTTLYYSANSGSFTVTATGDSSDPGGITSVDFPDVFGTDGGTDSSAPFTHTYSWTSSSTASGPYTVTLTDADGDTTADFTVSPDTAPTVSNTAPTEVTGAGDQYWSSSANTLWFRPAGTGSFTLNATAADAESGIAQVAFPDVSSTTGWSGSTGGTDTASAYASPVAYTWTASASAPGAKQVTATNGTGMTAIATVTIGADSTAPTGQTVVLSGGPWYSIASVPLTIGQGSDAGAGVDSARGIVERASAPLTNGVCGTFGTFAAVALTSGADAGVASGSCYRYQYKATDNVGNVSTASAPSADAKVDTTAPTTPTLLLTGTSNAAAAGNVVYYRPTGSGTFMVTAAASDAESGVTSYSFPAIAGFTAIGSGGRRTYTFSDAGSPPRPPVVVTATNAAGLTSAGAAFSLVPDGTPPTLTVRCNGRPCLGTTYPKAVTVTATATDGSGSGVDTIRYTTDGTEPTADRGIEYVRGFAVRSLTRLKMRAYDKAGNASKPVVLTVRSAADRLAFAAPPSLTAKAGTRYLLVRVNTTRRAVVSAAMTGPALKHPKRWRFILAAGTSIVRFQLPAGLSGRGLYRLVWTVQAGTQKTTKTTRVVFRPLKS
jgi:hypothetical protein